MALDRITLGSPKPANDFEAYQRSVEAWAREVEQAVRALEKFVRGMGVNLAGYGSPLGVLAAPLGSTYRRLDAGVNTGFYVKETEVVSGTMDTSGWAAK